jgi:hypothetical protein
VYFSLGCAYKAIHFTWKLTAYSYIVSLIFFLLGLGRMVTVVGSFFKPAQYFPTSGCCLVLGGGDGISTILEKPHV